MCKRDHVVFAAILLPFIDGGEERVMLAKDGDLSGLHDGCAQVTAAAFRHLAVPFGVPTFAQLHIDTGRGDQLAGPVLMLGLENGQDLSENCGRPHLAQTGNRLQQVASLDHQRLPTLLQLDDLLDEQVESFDDETDLQRQGVNATRQGKGGFSRRL